jgi:hypothetical protein
VTPGTLLTGVLAAVALASGGSAAATTSLASGVPIRVTPGTELTAGPWRQLAHGTSPRAKAAAFARGFLWTPTALAFTVTARQRERVRLFWSVYCEGNANDEIFTPQGSFTIRASFSAYPPVMTDAAKCFLTVRATPTAGGKAHVAVFGY